MVDRNLLNTPDGMKSYLPDTCQEFYEIREKIEGIFDSWGYRPIITPTLEYYQSLQLGMGRQSKRDFYKLIDYEGNILALKPEMTAPIARTVVNRMEEVSLPLRLSYFAPVFRYDSPQMGKNREIYQLGMEFIGEDPLAEAEVIMVAIESLKKAGLQNFKIDLGHTSYLDGIISELDLSQYEADKIKSYLNKKNFVGLRNYVEQLGIDNKQQLLELPKMRGDKGVLTEAAGLVNNPRSQQAIDKLEQVFSLLQDYDVSDYLNFDLGLIRGLDYYTGIVFEGFTEKLGYTICGGGRYDNLLEKYGGRQIPAVGFALGLQRVWLSLKKENYKFRKQTVEGMVVFSPETRSTALGATRELHQQGLTIILKEVDKSRAGITGELLELARSKSVERILTFPADRAETVRVIDVHTENSQEFKLEEGWVNQIWKDW
ncbi:MAG: ATP phosphoribosyltransferase regulatory subunit [Bacillota bacterium]